jgi:uncharacterized repeat protein (TIGR01451 family)
MKLFNFIKEKTKKLFAITAILVLATQTLLPSIAKASDFQPEFKAEKEVLRGMNLTQNQQDWSDPVTGNPGDEFRGLVWIHNGVPDTTAHDATVKVSIPSHTTNRTAVVSSTISASDANTLSDTLNVNLTEDSDISFIPGSVKLFKLDANNNTVEIPFPNGNGDSVVSANGVNIGDINGCFQYVHFVSFGFKVKPIVKQVPSFELLKTVRNVSNSEKDFVKSNFAKPGDVLEYNIDYSNTGNATADTFVKDAIPAGTTFVPGSVTIMRNGSLQNLSDQFVGDGVSVNSVTPGEKISIRFRVKVNGNVKDNDCLINTVTLFFNKISISDTAKTTVKISVTPTPTPKPTPTPLPVSGPVETTSAIISLVGMSMYGFLKYKKFMALKETKIIGQLLGK